ncbi:Uncharacterised protein [Candidatus Venteria ishoeyi]|uniref:Uncharacterized protein n=2 Tax=Candidatus Venteria ishoeyi TaxID=1899563 RepID=A0A1H6F6M1_9GAMM|nr:Uncharacterised protein [Candidatus Venteria ishoeyi]
MLYVKSNNIPEEEGVIFNKIDENFFSAEVYSETEGLHTVMNLNYAVNYHKEIQNIGTNEKFVSTLFSANGMLFQKEEIGKIIENAKRRSINIKTTHESLKWLFLMPALILLFLEITARRITRYRKLYK